jgi:protease IV
MTRMTTRRTRRTCLVGLAAGGLVALALGEAAASEPMPTRAEKIASPGRSIVSDESGESLALNPANLAFAPGAELRWTGVRCPDTHKVGCGHAFSLSSPLFFGLATGLRVDYVTPPGGPDGAGFPYDGYDFTWITWGLGLKMGDRLAVGATLQRSYSTNTYTDGLFGITAGITYRPYTRFAFAAVARDFNGPASQLLPPSGQPILDRSYAFGMAFRPTATRAFELGVEAKYLEASDQVFPRATAVLEIPGVGRARGDVEVANLGNDQRRGIVASAGLEISYQNITAGGGALFGSGLGTPQSTGQYATVSITGYTNPGVPRLARAVWIRNESVPGTRSHVALLRRLWRIADEKDVSVVTMVMRAEPAASYAHAEELADAFRLLRAKGKKVLCSWESAGSKALYACASADRIVINPSGELHYAGLRTTYFYLGKLLSNLGIKAEIVRIGVNKEAPEQFTNEGGSDVARRNHEDFIRQHEAVLTKNLSVYRKIPEEQVRASTAKGPFLPSEARDAGFLDGFAYDDELERVSQELAGRNVSYDKWEDETKAHEYFGPKKKVAILYVDGDMVDGRSSRVPLVDLRLVGGYTIAETAKKLKDDNEVSAVVLRVESPGGSSMAADIMWRELSLLAAKKPLIVSMGSTAASGGYYIASAGRQIFALPLTLTGSIGIFYGKADISELLRKIGIGVETFKTTPRADADSMFRPYTEEEKKEAMRQIKHFYDIFLDRVSQGRHMTKDEVDAVGQGHVWTGQQAVERRLVDKLGGLREALDAARAAGGLATDAPIAEYPVPDQTLLDRALELVGIRSGAMSIDGLPVQIKDIARAIAPMAIHARDVPLARSEWTPLEDMTGTDPE